MRLKGFKILSIILPFILSSCSFKADVNPSKKEEITGITLISEMTIYGLDKYQNITAYSNPIEVDVDFTWTNSDPTVVYFNEVINPDAYGKTIRLLSLKEGTATITAAYKSYSASCKVTVIDNSEGDLTINIVAFNDFHGSIEEDGRQMGLAKIGTYLKEASELDNTLTLSQGDDWQGSIYSNYNRGRLINDVYAYAKLSARTVGNHDFDWGVEALVENTKTGYEGYVTPVLAANVYDFDFATKVVGTTQQSDIGAKSVTYTLKNGLSVGIVGVIGKNQITSITSSYTQNIHFIDHISVIKEEATNLRNSGCDIVIASVHANQDDLIGNELYNYVDLVLCGHSHQLESYVEEGLFYYQFGRNGEYIGNVKLTYNTTTKKIINTTCSVIDYENIDDNIESVDTNIANLIATYNSECALEANKVVANNANGYFDKTEVYPNLMAKAIYDKSIEEGYDVDFTYVNESRAYFNGYNDSMTYADIYRAFPFDNDIYIVELKGSDIFKEIRDYNNVYFKDNFNKHIYSNQTYRFAVIDFLLFHTNSNRYYDFFYRFNPDRDVKGILKNNYRILLRDWLSDNKYSSTDKELSASDYSSNLTNFSKEGLILD